VSAALDTCGCFPELPGPPSRPDNLPGRDALAYRIGTHGDVLARMLVALPGAYPLDARSRLTTRAPDDPAIALLDAFAMVADVLSFYSERIANEGYLRTAVERRSVLELARAIGYELGPGVAASTFLTFGVEDRTVPDGPLAGVPAAAHVAAGTRVQSLPASGGLPQTFETGHDLEARGEWNELRLRLTREQELKDTATTVYLAGTATELQAGDVMLLAAPGPTGQATGTPKARRVHRVVPEPEHGRTLVELAAAPALPAVKPLPVLHAGAIGFARPAFTAAQADLAIGSGRWSERGLATLLSVYGWREGAVARYFAPKLTEKPALPPAAPGVYAFDAQAAPFGHNAPRWLSLPGSMRYGDIVQKDSSSTPAFEPGPYPKDWDAVPTVNVTTSSQGTTIAADRIRLDTTYRAAPDSWVVLAKDDVTAGKAFRIAKAAELSVADYALSAKLTELALVQVDGTTKADLTGFKPRATTVLLQSRRLELAEVALPDVLDAATQALDLDRLVLGLAAGRPVALSGERADLGGLPGTEIVWLEDITHAGGRTTLHIAGLQHPYVRRTVRIGANVAPATHGETVHEVLGSGTGGPYQRFPLRKPPLTYVSAATPSGARSTLEVRVDGVLWEEAPSLLELGPADERYVVQRDEKATTVIFGDGTHGARVPTGVENVVATYRSGIGVPGLVEAGALTLLAQRPDGVRDVTNPVAAAGAEDPESRDAARRNAPLTVMTLDRAVSLTDHEDLARAFAGIGKARATALWRGERQIVHLTVAGPAGAEVDPASDTFRNLVKAITAQRDQAADLEVEGFRRVFFHLAADALVDPRHEPATVLDALRAALAAAFGFDRREFGQGVSAAEAIAVILGVPGVLDTRVLELYEIREGEGAPAQLRQDPLLARLAHWDEAAGGIEPAELLLLNPAGAVVTERAA
jgi:predicted phage baseplate assembly protein